MSPSVGTRQAATNAFRIVHLLRALHQGFLLVCAIKKALSSGQRKSRAVPFDRSRGGDSVRIILIPPLTHATETIRATLLILTVVAQGPVF
jgi:hypothetical protein